MHSLIRLRPTHSEQESLHFLGWILSVVEQKLIFYPLKMRPAPYALLQLNLSEVCEAYCLDWHDADASCYLYSAQLPIILANYSISD